MEDIGTSQPTNNGYCTTQRYDGRPILIQSLVDEGFGFSSRTNKGGAGAPVMMYKFCLAVTTVILLLYMGVGSVAVTEGRR